MEFESRIGQILSSFFTHSASTDLTKDQIGEWSKISFVWFLPSFPVNVSPFWWSYSHRFILPISCPSQINVNWKWCQIITILCWSVYFGWPKNAEILRIRKSTLDPSQQLSLRRGCRPRKLSTLNLFIHVKICKKWTFSRSEKWSHRLIAQSGEMWSGWEDISS